MLAVTAVLLALCLIVNAANYISVDNSLTNMLQIISNNRGMVPQSPPGLSLIHISEHTRQAEISYADLC